MSNGEQERGGIRRGRMPDQEGRPKVAISLIATTVIKPLSVSQRALVRLALPAIGKKLTALAPKNTRVGTLLESLLSGSGSGEAVKAM